MIKKLVEILIRLMAVAVITVPFACDICGLAYIERGYSAIGGEWAAVILVAVGVWKLSGYLLSMPDSSIESMKEKARYRKNAVEQRKDI